MADVDVTDQRVRNRLEQHGCDMGVRAFVGGEPARDIERHRPEAGKAQRSRFADYLAREVLI
ncbi:hypothetical protein AFM18_07090 [Achromobacter spanius]|uniref:Uncharacterized protein n=1 Tax=Achromobacter spanius TaxID=217203 RepID=A0AAW3I8M6_9BURK|nr:hypothetical protein AFM18_07090 [Achromobacter spanius]